MSNYYVKLMSKKFTRNFKNSKSLKSINKVKSRKRIRLKQTRKYNKKQGGTSNQPSVANDRFSIVSSLNEIENIKSRRIPLVGNYNRIGDHDLISQQKSVADENRIRSMIQPKIHIKIELLRTIITKIVVLANRLLQQYNNQSLSEKIAGLQKGKYTGGFGRIKKWLGLHNKKKVYVETDSNNKSESDSTASVTPDITPRSVDSSDDGRPTVYIDYYTEEQLFYFINDFINDNLFRVYNRTTNIIDDNFLYNIYSTALYYLRYYTDLSLENSPQIESLRSQIVLLNNELMRRGYNNS